MAKATTKSAPLYVTKTASLSTEVTSYFDISTKGDGSSAGRSPASPADVSPGSLPRPSPPNAIRRPHFRFHSDYEALHRKIHGHTIDEDQSPDILTSESPIKKVTSGRSFERSPRRASLQSSESSAPSSPGVGSRSSKDYQTYPQHRPKVGQIWARPPSLTSVLGTWTTPKKSAQRRSSTLSEVAADGGNVILVRTDQTPLKPPPSKSTISSRRSLGSSIKVETAFTELDKVQQASQHPSPSKQESEQKTQSSVRKPHEARQSSEGRRRSSSRRSSINVKHIFSAPLHLLRRGSMPKEPHPPAVPELLLPSPVRQATRLPDHRSTRLKRNYTSEALQRVTAVLQDLKPISPASLLPPQVVRPSSWKTFSDKSAQPKTKKELKTVHGIISGLANHSLMGSGVQISEVQSYSSSQRNLREGSVPANTPDETAIYKIKRSPSAETEEFLKIDISIRGDTNYLPSEARRIHTPPLPEEGADGRWKGFFFDYNAPRGNSIAQIPQVPKVPEIVVEGVLDSGPSSPESGLSSNVSQHGLMPDSRPKLERTKTRTKRVLTGDWVDVKLAEIDLLGKETAEDHNQARRELSRCLTSPDIMSKNRFRVMHEGREVQPEMFDVTIPEHLPSSPLCPRHPRYWRVVKGKGSQFRGCWMHGIGVNEDRKLQ